MDRNELKKVLSETSVPERDALEQIIINGAQAKSYSANLFKLRDLGLIHFRNRAESWAYSGGRISEFFEAIETLVQS